MALPVVTVPPTIALVISLIWSLLQKDLFNVYIEFIVGPLLRFSNFFSRYSGFPSFLKKNISKL